MKFKETMKKFGEKNACAQVDMRSPMRFVYEPKLPSKIQQKMDKASQ